MEHDLGRLYVESTQPYWPTDCGELDAVANVHPPVAVDFGASPDCDMRCAAGRAGQMIEVVVFIDSGVSDVSAIVTAASVDAELVMLDPLSDGLVQIARYLEGHPGVKMISLLAPDCVDGIRLGTTSLRHQTMLSLYRPQLEAIRNALSGRVELTCVTGVNAAPCQSCVLGLLAEAIGAELVEA